MVIGYWSLVVNRPTNIPVSLVKFDTFIERAIALSGNQKICVGLCPSR